MENIKSNGELIIHKVNPFSEAMEELLKSEKTIYTRETAPSLRQITRANDGVSEVHVMVFPKKDDDYIQRIKSEGQRIGWRVSFEVGAGSSKGAVESGSMVDIAKGDKRLLEGIEVAYAMGRKPVFKSSSWVESRARACVIDFENTLVVQNRSKRYSSRDLITETATVVDGLSLMSNYIKIIILSNSAGKYQKRVARFLESNDIAFDEVYCKSDMSMSECEFKAGRLAALKNRYNVLFAIDDDADVCEMYRNKFGLTVFQCSSDVQMKAWVAKRVADELKKRNNNGKENRKEEGYGLSR